MVVDLDVVGAQVLALLQGNAGVFLFLLELGQLCLRCDPDHAAFATLVQALGAQHDVQCLIPRHVDQAQRHAALHGVRGNQIQARLLGHQLQHGAHRHVLEVEGYRLAAIATLGHGSRGLGQGIGGHRTGGRWLLPRCDLHHVFVATLVGQRLECTFRAEHQLRALAGGARIDALHRRGEILHVERTLQLGRQDRIADVDHDVTPLRTQIRHGPLRVELQDQAAGAVVTTLEIDLGDCNRCRLHLRYRIRNGIGRIGHGRRAAGQCQRNSQCADMGHCVAPGGTQAQGFGKSHRAIP